MIPRILPVIAGRGGAWPFAGCWYGLLDDGDPEGPWVAWAGRYGGADYRSPEPQFGSGDSSTVAGGLEHAWRSSRSIHRAMLKGGLPAHDRRRALSGVVGRLDPLLVLSGGGTLGGTEPDELAMIVVAGDKEGIALTGTGLGAILGIGNGEPVVDAGHPLLTVRGVPGARTGALSLAWTELGRLPRWLVAVPAGESAEPAALRRSAGIERPSL